MPPHTCVVEEEEDNAPGAARGVTQLRVFGRKNLLLALRNWKGSLGQLVSPIVIVFMLFGMREGVMKGKREDEMLIYNRFAATC